MHNTRSNWLPDETTMTRVSPFCRLFSLSHRHHSPTPTVCKDNLPQICGGLRYHIVNKYFKGSKLEYVWRRATMMPMLPAPQAPHGWVDSSWKGYNICSKSGRGSLAVCARRFNERWRLKVRWATMRGEGDGTATTAIRAEPRYWLRMALNNLNHSIVGASQHELMLICQS